MDVYFVRIDHRRHAATVRRLAAYVSANRLERANRYRLEEDFNRSIVGEALVNYIAHTEYDTPMPPENWRYHSSGKPYLPSRPNLFFNLSHAGEGVACVFDAEEIGIDLECVAPIDFAGIADRYFSSGEKRYLARQNGERKLAAFYRVWTQKESYLKAVGTGLGVPPDAFEIGSPGQPTACVRTPARTWFVRTAVVEPDYMLSVCSASPTRNLNVHSVSMEALADAYG